MVVWHLLKHVSCNLAIFEYDSGAQAGKVEGERHH